ncbi:MAG: hypothetical protein AB7L90_21445 [Hyphomicrobiaceae bacterium]
MQRESPFGAATQPSKTPAFLGAHLSWPFERRGRPFVLRIVEPREYRPAGHAELFYAVVNELLNPSEKALDAYTPMMEPPKLARFDLATFPEAFVPVEALVNALSGIAGYGPSGCIHVGLRPAEDDTHLFSLKQVQDLVERLLAVSAKAEEDLSQLRTWLARQCGDRWFNLGCLFAVDANGELRICLHPKAVRSQFETNPLPERHMAEADMLTLVTLTPVDKQYLTISLQPLICSDLLNLNTDRPAGGPLVAVNRHPDSFPGGLPDHIDIVSVATCTPQTKSRLKNDTTHRVWHEKFLDAFVSVASGSDYARHHFSAVVLANFREISVTTVGGLSGVFLPVPPRYENFPKGIEISCWGKGPAGGNNRWSSPDDNALQEWKNRGFVACLAPSSVEDEKVRIFCCSIQRLPRENSLWATPDSLSQCGVHVGDAGTTGTFSFKWIGAHV